QYRLCQYYLGRWTDADNDSINDHLTRLNHSLRHFPYRHNHHGNRTNCYHSVIPGNKPECYLFVNGYLITRFDRWGLQYRLCQYYLGRWTDADNVNRNLLHFLDSHNHHGNQTSYYHSVIPGNKPKCYLSVNGYQIPPCDRRNLLY